MTTVKRRVLRASCMIENAKRKREREKGMGHNHEKNRTEMIKKIKHIECPCNDGGRMKG